jgi:hypothetical protein
MDDEREKIIEKALKLRELANRGIGGEKDNAITMLKSYREKHSITDDEMNLFVSVTTTWYSVKTQEEKNTPFAKWFKNSVTVDEKNNSPLIFFHKSRTTEIFYEFSHDKGIKQYESNYGFAFVHEDDKRVITHIGNTHISSGVEFYCYLNMVNPYYIYGMLDGNCYGQNGEPHKPIYIDKNLCDNIIGMGFDSIIVQSEIGINVYIVFRSNQIKSKDNNGEYNTNNDNILM